MDFNSITQVVWDIIPTAFVYWTGVLIAWTYFLSIDLHRYAKICKQHHIKLCCNVWLLIGGIVATTLTMCGLAFNVLTTDHSQSCHVILLIELWYTLFLFKVSRAVYAGIVSVPQSEDQIQDHHSPSKLVLP